MRKACLSALLALVMLWVIVLPVLAETPSAPVLVDRINSPEEHADFAFGEENVLFEVLFPQHLNCDAILLRCGEETMLVDCATQGQAQRVIDMCKQLGITHIDKVVNTHPHEDHIGGFRDLIKEVTVDELWICFSENYNDHMKKAVGYAANAGIPVMTYADGDVLTLGGATIEVWQLDASNKELNDRSAQFLVTYGERTMLMAADLEKPGQNKYVELKGEKLDADILKYPHHGLEKLTDSYAAAVSPLFMVITNNQRSTEGKKYIQRSGIPYAYTVPGFVYLTTDGQTWVADRIVCEKKY
ncbi:MAG: MBL fold metallo-hydrolase [Clostridia bacterium]|nr:MBL fold metallo-hydrolase [Clostridia bacterium]